MLLTSWIQRDLQTTIKIYFFCLNVEKCWNKNCNKVNRGQCVVNTCCCTYFDTNIDFKLIVNTNFVAHNTGPTCKVKQFQKSSFNRVNRLNMIFNCFV